MFPSLSREIKLAVFYPEKEEVSAGSQLCFPSFIFLGEAKDGNALPTVFRQQEVKGIFPFIYAVPEKVAGKRGGTNAPVLVQ